MLKGDLRQKSWIRIENRTPFNQCGLDSLQFPTSANSPISSQSTQRCRRVASSHPLSSTREPIPQIAQLCHCRRNFRHVCRLPSGAVTRFIDTAKVSGHQLAAVDIYYSYDVYRVYAK